MTKKPRVYFLDILRGIAVLAMIVHHAYVLFNSMTGIYVDFFYGKRFEIIQFIFVFVFLMVSGVCTNYSKNIAKRGAVVFVGAMIVTLVTAVLLPMVEMYGFQIYFGILHMFGLTMLLYALLEPVLKKCNGIAVSIVALVLFGVSAWLKTCYPYASSANLFLIVLGFPNTDFYSADYYPLLPYFFLFVIGAMLGRAIVANKLPKWFYSFRIRPLEFVGRHSLLIYLLHQPLVLALIFLLNFGFRWF